jgi:hypothetical protein
MSPRKSNARRRAALKQAAKRRVARKRRAQRAASTLQPPMTPFVHQVPLPDKMVTSLSVTQRVFNTASAIRRKTLATANAMIGFVWNRLIA